MASTSKVLRLKIYRFVFTEMPVDAELLLIYLQKCGLDWNLL